MRITKLSGSTKQGILNNLLKRSPNNYSTYEKTVSEIIDRVRREGDRALFDYTLKFDGFALQPENIRVTKAEIAAAYEQLDEQLIRVIRRSAEISGTFTPDSCGTAGLTQRRTAPFWA